jgi:hypothetical protein
MGDACSLSEKATIPWLRGRYKPQRVAEGLGTMWQHERRPFFERVMDSNYTKRDIQFMFGDYEGLPMPSSGAEPEFYTLIRSTPPEQLYELFVSTYNETGRLPVSTDPGVLQASIDVLTKVVVNRSTVDRARVRAGDMDTAMKAEVAAHNKKAEFDGWVWGHIAMHSQIPPHIPNYYFDRSRRDVLHALTAGGDAPGWAGPKPTHIT